MAMFAILIAKLLDPISFITVFVVSLFTRKKLIIPTSALLGAIAIETFLTFTQYSRNWGQGFPVGIVASSLHAVQCYWIIGKLKEKWLQNK